jgi:hypothetical protein
MNETRQSLLLRARTGEENAWKDLTDLYRVLIMGWLRRQGVSGVDLEDLTRDVLLSVVKHLPAFEHSGQRGAFRSWRSPTRRAGAGGITPTRHARPPGGREDGCSGYKTI